MEDVRTEAEPADTRVVPVRRFWPLIPLALLLGLLLHVVWPDGPLVLRAVFATIVLVGAASLLVLTYPE